MTVQLLFLIAGLQIVAPPPFIEPPPAIVWPIGPHYRPATRHAATEVFRCRHDQDISISYDFVPSSTQSTVKVTRITAIRIGDINVELSKLESLNRSLEKFAAIPTISAECDRYQIRFWFFDMKSGEIVQKEHLVVPTH